jgi:hypothetical protein
MLFSVGYTLPHDQFGVIYSLSQLQNFLGDEGDSAPLQTPQIEGGTSPFWQHPDVSFGWGPRRKSGYFFNNISQTKTSVGGLNKAFFHHLRQQKGGGREKGVKRRVYRVMG